MQEIQMKPILWLSLLAEAVPADAEQKFMTVLNFVVFISIGLLLIIIAIPLLLGKIQPNLWYGFRIKKTLSDRNTWLKANRFMAAGFLILGVVIVIYNIWLITFSPAIGFYEPIGNLLILIAGSTAVIISSYLYLRTL